MDYIKKFEEIRMADIGQVGGKNASLGEMISNLSKRGIKIPTGFAITAKGYWRFLEHNNLVPELKKLLSALLDYTDIKAIANVGSAVRAKILQGSIPDDLAAEIVAAYKDLSKHYNQENCDVAVRSSATAEDLPTASFAGQQESYLNISGAPAVLEAYKKTVASLFTDRAIVYRQEKGFDHFKIALSAGAQKK